MDKTGTPEYPLPIARALAEAERRCAGVGDAQCHAAVLRLADSILYYLGAVAIAQYTQAYFAEQAKPDPTLSRSLRSLRRVLPGQWLGWIARGLDATLDEQVQGLSRWYSSGQRDKMAGAYEGLRRLMVEHLAYTGEYELRETVSPGLLLELVDQYRIRRGKIPDEALPGDFDAQVTGALLPGLRAMLESADFLTEYHLYAPKQRQLLMGQKPVTPMPPMFTPADADVTTLLYPPGEAPDYTKRPDLQSERVPLFPLDPLLSYLRCEQCDSYRVSALQEVVAGAPSYIGLDPDCGHAIKPVVSET